MRRGDLGRRHAHAQAARDPPRPDASGARGHPLLGRADRSAVGVRVGDLRALRLRPRRVQPPRQVRQGTLRAPRAGARLGPARRRRRGARALQAGLRARPGGAGRHAVPRRALVEGASSRRSGELAARGEQEVLCCGRARRGRRGVCLLPDQGRLGGRDGAQRGEGGRGDRDVGRGREDPLELPTRDRPHRPRRGLRLRPRLAAAAARSRPEGAQRPRHRRALAAPGGRRGGAAGPVLQAGRVDRARNSATSSARGTPAGTASGTTRAGRRIPPTSRSTSPSSARSTSAATTSTRSSMPGSRTNASPAPRRRPRSSSAPICRPSARRFSR